MTQETIKAAIVGASGYTGAELVRILSHHPRVKIATMTADRKAGELYGDVFPHLGGPDLPMLVSLDVEDFSDIDVVFCGLPHGTTQDVIAGLPATVKVIDLSADFRLKDVATYAKWYGHEHRAPDLQEIAVYGLSETNRDAIAGARLVANPGCYPTSAQLPLLPLVEAGMIQTDGIIIDAKSGVSGAGRAPKEGTLHTEVSEGLSAYAISSHRHGPEIEQELSAVAGAPVAVTFTPHLVPMNRGILSTIYARMSDGVTIERVREALLARYKDAPFVRVVEGAQPPATRHVRGSNYCLIGAYEGRTDRDLILVSVIDNLVKGASGQAVQNMNLMFGLHETIGLEQEPLFP